MDNGEIQLANFIADLPNQLHPHALTRTSVEREGPFIIPK